MWDAIGLKESVERMQAEGDTVPDWEMTLIEDGHESFYKKDDLKGYYYDQRGYKEVPVNKKEINLKQLKEANGVTKKNAGASLIDLGDGVAGLEFHSQSNAIGMDIIQMINYAFEEVEENYEGLVIGNQGKKFCVGANFTIMLFEVLADN